MSEMLSLIRAADIPVWPRLARIGVTSLLGAALETIALFIAVRVFGVLFEGAGDRVRVLHSDWSLAQACGVALAAVAVSAVFQFDTGRESSKFSVEYLSALRSQLLSAARFATTSAQNAMSEGRFQELTTSVAYQASLLPVRAGTIVASVVATAALILAAVIVEPIAAIALIACGALLALGMRSVTQSSSSTTDRHTEASGRLASTIGAWATRLSSFRVFGVEDRAQAIVDSDVDTASRQLETLRTVSHGGIVVYRTVTIALLIVLTGAAASSGSVDPIDATLVLVIVLRALSYSQQINAARQVAFEAIGPTRELLRERDSMRAARQPTGHVRADVFERLDLCSVSVEIDDRLILSGIDLSVRPGDRIGIVGPSGAGKSLLLDTIVALVEPAAGTIEFNGSPIADVAADDRAALIAVSSQAPVLIAGSLGDNVRFLRDDVAPASIRRSIEIAGLDDEGLGDRTELGTSESRVSGGQAQRTGFARALAGDPALLLLDEPTGALDARSETRVIAAIDELPDEVAVVVVSHRPEPLRVCDHFYAVDGGTLRPLSDLSAAVAYCDSPVGGDTECESPAR